MGLVGPDIGNGCWGIAMARPGSPGILTFGLYELGLILVQTKVLNFNLTAWQMCGNLFTATSPSMFFKSYKLDATSFISD